MKKAFDQTVRDLKRGVNKKVLKVPGVEQKVLDATSNEPWGPHGSLLAELAQATQNYHEYQMIMNVMWKRINDTGKNWRHVYKALIVLEYLVGHGSERVIEEIREHAYQISTLSNFQYVDSGGRDQGSNVRRKSQSLVALVNDKERIQEVRQKASANKDKYRNSALPGGAYRHSSYSGAGGHADRYDDDRYGYKDDDRNGQGRERDYGHRDDDRYGRGGDSYSRDGDHYDRDNEDRYGRDGYRDDIYRGRASEDYQPGSRRSVDRYTDRSLDDDDRQSSRSAGGKYDDPSQGERRLQRQLSEPNAAPPSYEEATRDAQSPGQNERDGATATSPAHKSSSSSPPKAASPSTSMGQVPENGVPAKPERVPDKELNAFDEFDPRVSLSAAPPVPSSTEFDFFGDLSASDSSNSLALALVTSATTTTGADMAISSGFGVDVPAPSTTVSSEPYENPFGDSPFKATLDEDFNAQPHNIAPVSSFQSSGSISSAEPFPPVASEVEIVPDFGFGDTFVGLTYNPSTGNGQQSSSNPSFSAQGVLPTSSDVLDEIFPQMGPSAQIYLQTSLPATTQNMQTTQMNYLPQAGLPAAVRQPTTSVSFESVQSSDPNNTKPGHLNLQGLPGSVSLPSQTAPDFSQAAQLSAPNGIQSAHVGVPQPGIQAAAQPTPYNMHPGHLNALQQPGLSASISLPSPAVSMYSHGAQPAPPSSMQSAHLNFQQQPGVPVPLTLQEAPGSAGLPAKSQPTKFEPKSAVWSDTLSRGLVDLNISGSKINPLADIGIDFDSINRKEKRKEMKSSATPVASTITMGKAMGSGSGMGRTSAGGLVQPPNPMMGSGICMGGGVGTGMVGGMGMGGGMAMGGYGGGMNQSPMGMGMGMGMNMGMGMGIGQGAQMRPPTGMLPPGSHTSGAGYNPMMGMGNYGPQQPFGGGQQQPYGGGYR